MIDHFRRVLKSAMVEGELARIRAEIERLQQQAQQLESDGRALVAAELAAIPVARTWSSNLDLP